MEKIFINHINNILKYLSNYIDITEITKRYNSCDYVFLEEDVYKVKIGSEIKEVDFKNKIGSSLSVIYSDKGKLKASKTACVIKKDNVPKNINNIIFHELMHIGSTETLIINNNKLIKHSGIQTVEYENIIKTVKIDNNASFLNEALTELVAKVIYDELYEDKYTIVEKINNKLYKSKYKLPYFLLSFSLLNYFEKNKKDLFEIYFNNNIELLKEILKRLTNLELDDLINAVNSLENISIIPDLFKKIINKFDKINPLINEDVRKQYNLLEKY